MSACDPRKDRLLEIATEGPLRGKYSTLQQALSAAEYDGFVIASPPLYHVEQALQLLTSQPRWVLCEKPLSIAALEARRLEPRADRILLGYTYRWWPPIQAFRQRLLSGEIGEVRHLRFVMSANLRDWHPWEKYQDFFMARRDLGGGALLDESHFLDLMLWMLGDPSTVYAQVDRISRLEIDSDDNVDILVSYPNGIRVNLHLDLIGRPHERSITAVGEAGTLAYSYEDNTLKAGNVEAQRWSAMQFQCERNEMFLAAAAELLALIREEKTDPSCSVRDGVRTLVVVDACRLSALSGRAVVVDG